MQEQGKVKRERKLGDYSMFKKKMLSLVQVLTFTWIISYARIIVQAPQLEKNKTYLGQPGSIQKQTVAHQGFPFYLKIRKTKGNEHRKTTRTEETL